MLPPKFDRIAFIACHADPLPSDQVPTPDRHLLGAGGSAHFWTKLHWDFNPGVTRARILTFELDEQRGKKVNKPEKGGVSLGEDQQRQFR